MKNNWFKNIRPHTMWQSCRVKHRKYKLYELSVNTDLQSYNLLRQDRFIYLFLYTTDKKRSHHVYTKIGH